MAFNYLKEIRNLYENSTILFKICFIMGNNTCDMDSALSAYLLSIGKNIQKGVINLNKKGEPSINLEAKKIYLPVLNIKRGTLPHRIDVKYVFDKFNIYENDFWYISDDIFNPDNLFKYKNNANIKTSIILVDHTILMEKQKYLSEYVTNIYDHHLLSNYNGEYKNLKKLNIKYPVGSCSTLILSEFFNNDDFPVKVVSPVLSLSAILLDTKKFNPDFYKNRWVDLDRKIYKKIKKVIKKDENIKIKMKKYFKEIKDLKHDVNLNLALGFEPLLAKDQKFYKWNKKKVIWSSFPISFYDIKKKFGEKKILKHYMEFYKGKTDEEKRDLFFITNSSSEDKQRLFTIFNPIKLPFNENEIKNELIKKSEKDFFSVDIKNVTDEYEKPNGEVVYIVLSDTYSRKSFEPILKNFFNNLKSDNEIECDENK